MKIKTYLIEDSARAAQGCLLIARGSLPTVGLLTALLALFFCLTFSPVILAQESIDYRSQFEEVIEKVETYFYDSTLVSTPQWKEALSRSRDQVRSITKSSQLEDVINSLLSTLNTSHTYYFSKENPKRYQLLGVFNSLYDQDREDLFIYEGIGIDIRKMNDHFVISAVFDGFPAQEAGLKFGDRLLTVNDEDFHPINSFKGKAGESVTIKVNRRGIEKTTNVKVTKLDGRTMFEAAAEASARLIDHEDKKIGYIHLWSYAGAKYQDLLRGQILWGNLSKADALVLDLRDGWGGADLNYLSLFREPIAIVSSRTRQGQMGSYSGVWEKPVALLINERSTSGKELFTYGFKKLKLGPVVGHSTAGAVVGGRIFLLSNGDVLYLAATDVNVDGVRLEGKGVDPDTPVDRTLMDPPSGDPQLQKAMEEVVKRIK